MNNISQKPGPTERALLSLNLSIDYCTEAGLSDLVNMLKRVERLLALHTEIEKIKQEDSL